MKTYLRFCIALVLAVIVQGYSFAQTLTTTLGSLENVKSGITREFTVNTQGGSGQMVTGKIAFSPYQTGDVILLYKAPGAENYSEVTIGADGMAMFGPQQGFAFSADATTHAFRIMFNRGDTYNYTISLQTVGATPQTVASATGSVVVTTPTQFPTIEGTLDVISDQEQGIPVNQQREWQILLAARDFVGVKGNIQIVLANPAQRNNISLFYDAQRAITNGGDPNFQPLNFNEQGIATIGPAEGETLTETNINQIMRATFTEAGTYAYTLRFLRDDGNPISSVQETIIVKNVAGIDDMIGASRISVYPTLAKEAVRIDLGDVRNASVSVTDMLGRVVMQLDKATGTVQLSTSTLAKGTYFVKVVKGKDVAGSRFVVIK